MKFISSFTVTNRLWRGVLGSALFLAGMLGKVDANAATLIFRDKTDFLKTASTLSLESFEELEPTDSLATDTLELPDFTVMSNGNTLGVLDEPFNGGFATDGSQYIRYQSGTNEILQFKFNQSINSFGLNITDWGDFGLGFLIFTNNAGDSFFVAMTPGLISNNFFFGAINPEINFDRVLLLNTIPGEAYSFDEVYSGITSSSPIPVPESSSTLLTAFGVCWVGLRLKRQMVNGNG